MPLGIISATLHYKRCKNIQEAFGLQRLFSTFPGGWPGLGLLLLRLAVGSAAVGQATHFLFASGAQTSGMWLIIVPMILMGASLVVGFLTPIASIVSALANICFEFTTVFKGSNSICARVGTIEAIVVTVALAILGAGAYSFDAFLFGRREIIIPDIPGSSK